MPIIPPVDTTKHVEYQAPYTSTTFVDQMGLLYDGHRILSGLQVSSDGVNASVTDGAFIQRGIIVEVRNIPNIAIPGVFPTFLIADNVDQISSTDVNIAFVDAATVAGDPELVVLAEFSSALAFDQNPELSIRAIADALGAGAGNNNYIINGGFEADQRAGSGTQVGNGVGTWGPDAWKATVVAGTTGTSTISRTTTPGEFFSGSSGLKCVVTLGDSARMGAVQEVIQSQVRELRNRPVSIRCQMLANVPGQILMEALDGGGSVIGSPAGGPRFHSGGGAWEELSATFVVPANAARIRVRLLVDGNDTFFSDEVNLTVGADPNEYIPDLVGVSNHRIDGLYEVGSSNIEAFGTDDGTSFRIEVYVPFRATKVQNPAIIVLSNTDVREDGANVDVSGGYTISAASITSTGFIVQATKPQGGQRPRSLSFDWTAESNPF
jgi:hypothetical protein